MTGPVIPEVECEQQHAALQVSDVLAAADFYTKKLGFRLAFMWASHPISPVSISAMCRCSWNWASPVLKGARCTSWSVMRTSFSRSNAPTAWRSCRSRGTGNTDFVITGSVTYMVRQIGRAHV